MWLRRAFFLWLLPAAVVLPLWLIVGWAVSGAGGGILVWTLFIAAPAVFVTQLIATLLVRARGTVRHGRAVSWWDVAVFGVWHLLIVVLAVTPGAFWPLLLGAIGAYLGVVWSSLVQLFREARGSIVLSGPAGAAAFLRDAARPDPRVRDAADVIVIEEGPQRGRRRF